MPTVSFQLWLRRDLQSLGWTRLPPLLSLYEEPLSTWCDMTHVLPREDTAVEKLSAAVHTLCTHKLPQHECKPVRAMVEAMNGTVDEVIRVAEAEAIEADIHRTDELMVATKPAQIGRMQAEVAHRRHWGEEGRVFEKGAADLAERIRIPGALGAMVVTNVARVQPAKLIRIATEDEGPFPSTSPVLVQA